ncbi:hypothetical protein ACOMHN_002024 [Nucella lapillus]
MKGNGRVKIGRRYRPRDCRHPVWGPLAAGSPHCSPCHSQPSLGPCRSPCTGYDAPHRVWFSICAKLFLPRPSPYIYSTTTS